LLYTPPKTASLISEGPQPFPHVMPVTWQV